MKKKQIISLIAMLVVVLALGGGYAAIKGVNDKKEEAAKEEEEQESETTNVYTINKDDVIGINITNASGNLDIVYKDAAWVSSQGDVPMDSEKVTAMLDAVSSFDAIKVIAENESDLSQYGLDNPSLSYTITTKDGMTYKASFGIVMPTNSNAYYALLDGADKVYTVSANYFEPFNTSLVDMTEIVDEITVNPEYITSYELNKKDGTEFMAKHFDKDETVASSYYTWRIESPYDNVLADTDSFKDVLNVFDGFKFNSCVAYQTEDLSQYGLDKPYATVTVDYTEEVESEDSSDSSDDAEAEDSESSTADAISADSSDESDTSDTDSSDEKKTETVEKQLVLYVGDETDSDSRYVTTDNKEVYTMSNDTLNAVIDKEASDLWSLIVSYLSVNNLDQLQVTYNGETNTVNVSRETSTDNDGNDKETVTYKLNGEELDDSKSVFTIFYNKLTNMAAQKRLTEEYTPSTDPEMTATFTDTDGKEMTVSYYAYDTNYYAAVVDSKVFLVNKMNVKEMFSAYQAMAGNNETESDTSESQDTSDTEEAEATETPSVTESAEEE